MKWSKLECEGIRKDSDPDFIGENTKTESMSKSFSTIHTSWTANFYADVTVFEGGEESGKILNQTSWKNTHRRRA